MPKSSEGGWLWRVSAQARKSPLAAALLRSATARPVPAKREMTFSERLADEVRRGDCWNQSGVWQGIGPEPEKLVEADDADEVFVDVEMEMRRRGISREPK
jgi:hypothetical protein